jgi:hypothetical protein
MTDVVLTSTVLELQGASQNWLPSLFETDSLVIVPAFATRCNVANSADQVN